MKTAKQLQEIYISMVLSGNRKSKRREALEFIKEVDRLVYQKNTVRYWLNRQYGLPQEFDGTYETYKRLKIKVPWGELERWAMKDNARAERRIISHFEKYRIHLNDLYNQV